MKPENKASEYPFDSFAWDDDISNNNRWCDAVEVESAYDALQKQLDEKELVIQAVSKNNLRLGAENNINKAAAENGARQVAELLERLKEPLATIAKEREELKAYHFKLQATLEAENRRLREHLHFTVNAAENLYQPDKPLHKGLCPTFYHTLTYEGDLELIAKTKAAREALKATSEGEGK